jgi:hypothetical protein
VVEGMFVMVTMAVVVVHPRESGGGDDRDGPNSVRGCTPTGEWRW